MKLEAVRALLAAVLTVALLIVLIPATRAHSENADSEIIDTQSATQHARRDKNGQPVNNPDTQDSSNQSADQNAKAEPARPVSNSQSKTQPPVKSSSTSPRTTAKQETSPLQGSAQRQDRDAPPFDRPPVGSHGQQPANGRDVNTGATSQTNSRRPTYSSSDNGRQSDSGQYPRRSTSTGTDQVGSTDSSTAGSVDPTRSDRSGGAPPVLRRPADSRNDGASRTAKPPVLHRPSDPQPSDADNSSDVKTGRPYPSGQQAGQQGGSRQQNSDGEDEVVKLESTLVSIPLLVSDRSGRYIPQLRASDFLLYEDGVEQKIASLGTEEVPFNVVLLLDVSPSVSGSIKDIQDAAIAFVKQLREQDRVMVVSFDRNIHYLSDFTSDRRELEWAIRRANMGGGTSVYDAVYETVDRKLRNIEGRKALILFSDGDDTTSSRASYDDAVNIVSESDVLVYGLRYPGGGGGGGGGGRGNSWPRTQIPIPRLPFPFPFPWPMPRRRGHFSLTGSALTGSALMGSGPATNGSAAVQSWPRRRGGGGDFMKDITAAGGGPVYDAERISDLSGLAHRIAEELRHVYVLSYYPTKALSQGGYRRIRVSVRNRDDIAVRHRPGYNARPNSGSRPTI